MNDNENNLFIKLVFSDLSEIQALLESGVNIDEHKNEHGDTALYNTLFLGDLKRVKLLLEYNARMLVLILRIITDKRFYIVSYHLMLWRKLSFYFKILLILIYK